MAEAFWREEVGGYEGEGGDVAEIGCVEVGFGGEG